MFDYIIAFIHIYSFFALIECLLSLPTLDIQIQLVQIIYRTKSKLFAIFIIGLSCYLWPKSMYARYKFYSKNKNR